MAPLLASHAAAQLAVVVLREHAFTFDSSLKMGLAYADMVAIMLRGIPGQGLKGTKQ